MASRPADTTIFVAEQQGRVLALRAGTVLDPPVLDLGEEVTTGTEQGLLGMTFSPDGERIYLHFTSSTDRTSIVEYSVVEDGDAVRVDPASRRTLLTVRQPQFNHSGGQLAFGRDGLLYIGLGDGGGVDDRGPGHARGGNGQSVDSMLGKILRIDPTPDGNRPYTIPPGNPFARGGGRPEICDWGLRNPWRFSFDEASGDLWIGDVGQDSVEEVDRLPARAPCGANLGWRVREGDGCLNPGETCDLDDSLGRVVQPVTVQRHARGACAVIGGFVYRGSDLPDLKGWYVFTDYCDGRLRALSTAGNGSRPTRALGPRPLGPVAFGQDNEGELYVLTCSACGYEGGDPSSNGIYRLSATNGTRISHEIGTTQVRR